MISNLKRYKWGLFLVVTVLWTIENPGVASVKDTLIIGLEEKTTFLDPAKVHEIVSAEIVNRVYERLVTFEEGNYTQPVPELAESWELSEDGKIWTFHLRQRVTFSSGNPVNAEAVVFSLRRVLRLAGNGAWILTQFELTEGAITQIDDHTVQIILKEQYAPGLFLSCLATVYVSIVDHQIVMEYEVDGDMGSTWLETHSAGSGQYVLAERTPQEQIVLQANPRSWKGQPVFKTVILKHVPEPLSQMALLEQGEIDVAYNLQSAQFKRLKANPDIRIARGPLFHIRLLGMNLAYEPFKKPEVRDAVRYAIDYDGIIEQIFGGAAIKIQTIIPKGIPGYNPAAPYTRDLEKAKQLLSTGGYPDGFDVELLCFDSSPWLDVATKLKTDLAGIGINVQLNPLPASEAIKKVIARQFQMMHGNWNLDYADPSGMAVVFAHSDSAGDDATIKLWAWWHNYVNLETSKLTEEGMRELDQQKRAEIYQKITNIILDDGPYAVLFSLLKQYAYRAEVEYGLGSPSPFYGFPAIR